MVRSVKTPLQIIIGNASLTFRQMSILLTEIEGMVNNLPLSTVTDEPDDLTPITTAELIIGRWMAHCQIQTYKKTIQIFHICGGNNKKS
jgi:hypothetical protein